MHIDFNSSGGPSLGVEVEFELVDRTTRELASAAREILEVMGEGHPDGEHPKAKHELFECTIEIITGICSTVAEAKADLAGTLAEVEDLAAERGLALMCSGTHPFSDWRDQRVTADPRYEALVADMAWMAERLQIFGVHYHVGCGSVGAQHHRAASRYVSHVIDKHHPGLLERVDDSRVVNDLVVAIDGRFEDPDHPGQRLDRHFNACAESARFRQENLSCHGPMVPGQPVILAG